MTKSIRSSVWLAAVMMTILLGMPAVFADATPAVAPSTTLPSDGNFKLHPPGNINCAMRVGAMVGKRCDVIFIGDSITQHFIDSEDGNWNVTDGVTIPGGRKFDLTGRAVWEKHYAGRHVLNFGVGSDGTEHMLWRMDNMSIAGFKPKVAVILAGTNDTKFPSDQVAMGVHAVVEKTRTMFPQAKIILVSILPNARALETTMAANKIIATFADEKGVFYFDLAAKMTPVGDNWRGVGHDHLHLTPEGYELWATEMEPLLSKLLAE